MDHMEQAQMEFSPLTGQEIDPETFRRVWQRVMPDQAQSPPEGMPSTPQGDVPQAPPPDAQWEAPQEDGPASPPEPAASTPQAPRSASRPFSSEEPPFCLGPQSQHHAQTLQALMGQAQEGAAAGQRLARRGGSHSRALSALAADHRRALRQLSAAHFLITGQPFRPAAPAPALSNSLPLALREQFVWEQRWERACRQAAQEADDPCLRELYEELARDGALHAGAIRSLLEQMQPLWS